MHGSRLLRHSDISHSSRGPFQELSESVEKNLTMDSNLDQIVRSGQVRSGCEVSSKCVVSIIISMCLPPLDGLDE
jgi:hypothetical protein